MASSFLDVCRFNPTLGGTTDWTYSSAVVGYLSPALAGAINGAIYSYRAENNSLTEFEEGFGAYNSGTGVFARTTVLSNSLGTTAKISFTSVPQVAIVALSQDLLAFNAAMTLTAAQQDQARANIGVTGRNKIINGGFTVNQRVYASAGALAAGIYGHDRWKAGASGGDYSFTQLASPTTITIAASKSLIQVVENKNVEGGSYILSWTGTATARVTVNSATPAGNFAVSPITVSGQTAGTTMSVEFTGANAVGTSAVATNTGTLGQVQLEAATKATPFEFRPFQQELALCQRYLELSYDYGTAPAAITNNGAALFMGTGDAAGSLCGATAYFKQTKCAIPTVTAYSPNSGATGNARNNVGGADIAVSVTIIGTNSFWWFVNITDGNLRVHWKAEAEL